MVREGGKGGGVEKEWRISAPEERRLNNRLYLQLMHFVEREKTLKS